MYILGRGGPISSPCRHLRQVGSAVESICPTPPLLAVKYTESQSNQIHRKKRFTSFPSPAGMSLTKLPLGRNNSVMTSLFPPRESLVVTSRLGTGNSRTFFLRCTLPQIAVELYTAPHLTKFSPSSTNIQYKNSLVQTCQCNESINSSGFYPIFWHILFNLRGSKEAVLNKVERK